MGIAPSAGRSPWGIFSEGLGGTYTGSITTTITRKDYPVLILTGMIDLEGRVVKDGVRKAVKDRQNAFGGGSQTVPEASRPNATNLTRGRVRRGGRAAQRGN